MRKNLLLLLLLSWVGCFAAGDSYGQKPNREFGVISKEDFGIEYKDPNAEAIVLFDIGTSHFNSSLDLVLKRHVRIKVLNNAGLRWAEVNIPFYNDGNTAEAVTTLDGYTYNLVGDEIIKTALESSSIFNEERSGYIDRIKFAMPAVREGSIIEYRYELWSPVKYNLTDWEFQARIPTLYSSYEARLTPFYEYVYIVKGEAEGLVRDTTFVDDQLKRTYNRTAYKETVHRFEMENIPAFHDEDFLSSEEDHIIKLDFQLSVVNRTDGSKKEFLTTWEQLVKDLAENEDFGRYIEEAGFTYLYDLRKLGLENMPKPERAKAIIEYVRSNYRWNGYYGKLASRPLKEFHKQKTGNIANLNLFLIGLLRASGIEANPVIISTRGNGKIYKNFPFEHYFNYVIAMISFDEATIFVDASDPVSPYDELPLRCLNDDGLLVKKGFEKWVPVRNGAKAVLEESYKVSIGETFAAAYYETEKKTFGYEATNLRKKVENNEQKIIEYLEAGGVELLGTPVADHYSDPSLPYQISYSSNANLVKVDSKIHVSPFITPIANNLFTSEIRKFPIDLGYARKMVYTSEIEIPEGYKVENLPASYKLANVLYALEYKCEMTADNKVAVSGSFDIKFATYKADFYVPMRMAISKAVDLFNQKITLAPTE